MNKNKFQASLKDKVVLADFGAPWCAPCKAIEPCIKAMIQQYEGKALIIEINIDEQGALATDYSVQSIPTLIIFDDGREVKRLVGLQSVETIEQSLNEALENKS